jgi:hypothetical protein
MTAMAGYVGSARPTNDRNRRNVAINLRVG